MPSEVALKELEAHLQTLERCRSDEGTDLAASTLRMLSSIEPSFALATRPPEVLVEKSPSERAWLFDTFVLPVTQGLLAQTRLDYASSATEFNRVYPVLSRMGGTMVLRDDGPDSILFFPRADPCGGPLAVRAHHHPQRRRRVAAPGPRVRQNGRGLLGRGGPLYRLAAGHWPRWLWWPKIEERWQSVEDEVSFLLTSVT